MNLQIRAAENRHHASLAFTLVELMVVVVIIVVLAGLLLPVMYRPRVDHSYVYCVSNLKQVALAFKMYAGDNEEKLPWEGVTSAQPQPAWRYFLMISNELGTAKILACPGDVARWENRATTFTAETQGLAHADMQNHSVSYFLGVSTSLKQRDAMLTGDCNLSLDGRGSVFSSRSGTPVSVPENTVWNPLVNWSHHGTNGNLVLCDGSVQRASNARLQQALRLAHDSYGTNANRLLFPQ